MSSIPYNSLIIIGALIIAGVILLAAVGIRCEIKNSDEQDRQAYQGGWAGRSKVSLDLAVIGWDARVKCHGMGLREAECPRSSDRDTFRRVIATLMTQTIERNGPAWRGMAYLPETIRAMNHQFYDLILWLEENQCTSGIPARNANGASPQTRTRTGEDPPRTAPRVYFAKEILEQLREAEFIYKCGQVWSIMAGWSAGLSRRSTTSTESEPAN